MRPTLHLCGLPHTNTTHEHTVCAFTTKNMKFCEMMTARGWDIVVYSGERNEAECAEHVPCFTDREQALWYGGELDQNTLPTLATWQPTDLCWLTFNARVAAAIRERAEPHDIVLITGGLAQQPVAQALPDLQACEHAAGYVGIFARYVCFESYAWRHYLYGRNHAINEGRWFDTVIPNFFRPGDFTLAETKDDYLLFVGRLIERKGLRVAADIAKESSRRLVVAGSGAAAWGTGFLDTFDGVHIEGDIEYVGPVGAAERNDLMGRAHALLCPTTYIEPFGAVAVEAQLCGTPAITTDWGAFTETVDEKFRFTTLEEGLAAVEAAVDVWPRNIRERALERFSLDAIAPRYERWFDRLSTLWADGWYELPLGNARTPG